MRRGVLVRRVVVTVVAGVLIITAELSATLSPAAVHPPSRQRPKAIVRPTSGGPEPGEPVLRSTSSVPRLARAGAATFVRDYALWSSRRVVTMPVLETTRRVLGLLEQGIRVGTVDVANAVASVRIARAARRYVELVALPDGGAFDLLGMSA